MSTFNERIARLRQHLDRTPTSSAWSFVIDYIDEHHEAEGFELDVNYIETHLQHWPDHICQVPTHWKGAWLAGEERLFFSLFRSCKMEPHLLPRSKRSIRPTIDRLLRCPHLEALTTLDLAHCHFLREQLQQLLQEPRLQQLEQLSLRGHTLGVQELETLLDHFPSLKSLDLSNTHLEDREAICLAQLGHQTIQSLRLDSNMICHRGAKAFFATLSWPALTHLSVRDNDFNFSHEAIHEAVDTLFTLPLQLPLQSLDLSENGLHAVHIQELLQYHWLDQLRSLSLREWELDQVSLEQLTDALPQTALRSLDLRHCVHAPRQAILNLVKLATEGPLEQLQCPWKMHTGSTEDQMAVSFSLPCPSIEQLSLHTKAEVPLSLSPPLVQGQLSQERHPENLGRSSWGWREESGVAVLTQGQETWQEAAFVAELCARGLLLPDLSKEWLPFASFPDEHADEAMTWLQDQWLFQRSGQERPVTHPLLTLCGRMEELHHLLTDIPDQPTQGTLPLCTATAAHWSAKKVMFASIGYHWIYRWREGELCCLHIPIHPQGARFQQAIPTDMMIYTSSTSQHCLGSPKASTLSCLIDTWQSGDIYCICTDAYHQLFASDSLRLHRILRAQRGQKEEALKDLSEALEDVIQGETEQRLEASLLFLAAP